jgi:arginine exporter protein ArgO
VNELFDVALKGLVTGWAIAVPVGAVGALLVTLTARTSWQVGAAGAMGIATVDGGYALLAVVGGAALAELLEPVATALRIASGVVLLAVAAITAATTLTSRNGTRDVRPMTPRQSYALFVGITAINPATVVYFAAIVLGNTDLTETAAQSAVFVLAAFVASASWQLLLASGGATLGRAITSPRGRRVTGLVSAAVIAVLAVHTMTR